MSIGMILLVVVAVLVLFGVGQRVLDRMRLSDRMALVVVALIFVGGFIPSIPFTPNIKINIGGAIVPFAMCVYLMFQAGTAWERWRAVIASVVAGAAVFFAGRFFPAEPEAMPFDINYLYGIMAGLVAYLLGRSRISAFIAGVMGILLADIAQAVVNAVQGVPFALNLGGGGAFDAVVLSGFLAVILAEVMGEIIERFTGAKRNVHVENGKAVLRDEVEDRRDHHEH